MKRPRFVLLLSKRVEKMNNNSISNRFMDAIIEPIIVSQFLVVAGNFMCGGLLEVQPGKYKINNELLNGNMISSILIFHDR